MSERTPNPDADAWAMFCKETADHELTVIHDDGLYRHLRLQQPGPLIFSWDVVTWPGHLVTSGDIVDGYVFTRTRDMLTFFELPDQMRNYYGDGRPCIDVRYWAEKLCGRRSLAVKKYNRNSFLTQARKHLEENDEPQTRGFTLLKTPDEILRRERLDVTPQPPAERRQAILDDARLHAESEVEAHTWLTTNEQYVGSDTFEWDLREYDAHFLLACYAIDLTVQLYRRHQSRSHRKGA